MCVCVCVCVVWKLLPKSPKAVHLLSHTNVPIHHSTAVPVLSGGTHVIHHFHGNCLFAGQLCKSATHQTFNVPRPLLSPSARHHSAIRLSQTTSTLHQCWEEKGGGVYSFIHFSFILYPFGPRQAFSCLPLPSLHWRQSGWTCDMSRQGRLFDCRQWQPNTKAVLNYLTINLGDLRLDINST